MLFVLAAEHSGKVGFGRCAEKRKVHGNRPHRLGRGEVHGEGEFVPFFHHQHRSHLDGDIGSGAGQRAGDEGAGVAGRVGGDAGVRGAQENVGQGAEKQVLLPFDDDETADAQVFG